MTLTLELKTKRKISKFVRGLHQKGDAWGVRFGPDGAVSYLINVINSRKPMRCFAGWDKDLVRDMQHSWLKYDE